MKNKSTLIAIIVFVIISMCFNIAAFGGEYDTPIIPVPGNSASQGGSSEDSTGGNWETPPVDITPDSSTDEKKEPVAISKCTFSKIANVTYSGKATKPSLTVKYSGKTLKKGTDYTLSYSANKNVGTATVTVTGKGDFTDSKKLTFKINPKGTSVTKATSPKKQQLKVTWKKQTTQTTGYQIQCSADKNFKKGNKTVTVSKNKTKSKTLTKLKSKKKYYVRIRAYKTVKGTKYYSGWKKYSKAIKVK